TVSLGGSGAAVESAIDNESDATERESAPTANESRDGDNESLGIDNESDTARLSDWGGSSA
ncbi:hypothetical protein EVA_18145, partial [gut metagenome]